MCKIELSGGLKVYIEHFNINRNKYSEYIRSSAENTGMDTGDFLHIKFDFSVAEIKVLELKGK
jgi:hypothetical protein